MATARRQTTVQTSGLLRAHTLSIVLVLAALAVGLAALLPLVQSSSATGTAGNIRALEQEKAGWRARVRGLELEVAGLGSLSRIEAEAAARLKMTPPKEAHYVTVDAQAPAPRRLPGRYAPIPTQAPGDSSFLEDLIDLVPFP